MTKCYFPSLTIRVTLLHFTSIKYMQTYTVLIRPISTTIAHKWQPFDELTAANLQEATQSMERKKQWEKWPLAEYAIVSSGEYNVLLRRGDVVP